LSQTLAALEKLQSIDLELDALTGTSGDADKKVSDAEAALQKTRAAADAERGRVADAERERGRLERQLADDKDRLKKWDGRIVQAKHQKDFTALQREAEGLRKSIAAVEEALVKQRSLVEESKSTLKTRDADASSKQVNVDGARDTAQKARADSSARIAELQAERAAARTGVDTKLLSLYEGIRKKRPGAKVLVPVVNGACSGCYRKIQPAIYHRLMSTGAVELCSCAARLIYARTPPPPA